MPDVRTTFQPGEVVSISEIEFTDLDRQGLILEVVTAAAAPVESTATVKVTGTAETKTDDAPSEPAVKKK